VYCVSFLCLNGEDNYRSKSALSLAMPVELLLKLHKEGRLAFQYFAHRGIQRQPGCSIHFRKLLLPPGLWGPFHREGVAFQFGGVEISFNSPGDNDLATGRRKGSSGINSPLTAIPVSSANSRLTAARGSSSSPNSPLGIDHTLCLFWPRVDRPDGPTAPPGYRKHPEAEADLRSSWA
jgi:hypothetical protein